MPITVAPFTPEELAEGERAYREKAFEWLDQHWHGSRECPICRSRSWAIGELVLIQVARYSSLAATAWRFMCPVTCLTCYYTWQFDAAAAGVISVGEGGAGHGVPIEDQP